MVQRTFSTTLPASVEEVWRFHQSVEALKLLTPPGFRVEVLSEDVQVRNGALHRIRTRRFGVPMVWEARISDVDPPHRFVDSAERSPFAFWRHEHRFEAVGPNETRLIDSVTYRAPLGFLGKIAERLVINREIENMFAYRHRVTREHFAGSAQPAPSGEFHQVLKPDGKAL